MQNKKSIFIIAAFLVCFGLIYFFILGKKISQKNEGQKKTVTQSESVTNLPKLYCTFNSDQEAFGKAVADNSIDICSCVDDEDLKGSCINSVSDKIIYDKALSYLDENLCSGIKSQQSQSSCLAVVKDSIVQLKERDPQRLASIYAMSHNENAIVNYEKIIDNGSIDIRDYLSLALAYAEKGLKEQEQGRSQDAYVNKAFEVIEKAKVIDSKSSELYRVEAYINEIKPDYNRAEELYGKALEININNVLAYAGRGHLYRMKGSLDRAISDFNMAATLDNDKKNVFIYTNLCNLEFSRSHLDDSVKNCEIVVKNKEADPVFRSEAYQIMAMILMQNKDINQARNYLLNAKTITPNDANLFVTLSRLNIFEKRYQEAEENARKSMELSPYRASSYLALSHALYMQGKFNDSIESAEKGLTLVAGDVSLLGGTKSAMQKDLNYSIANNYRQMGESSKAESYEKRASEAVSNE